MLFMVMIIVGITQSVKCLWTAPWVFCGASFLILAVGLRGLSTEAEIFSYFLSPLALWERGRG